MPSCRGTRITTSGSPGIMGRRKFRTSSAAMAGMGWPAARKGAPVRCGRRRRFRSPAMPTRSRSENYDDQDYGYLRVVVTATQLRIEYHPASDGEAAKTPDDFVTVDLGHASWCTSALRVPALDAPSPPLSIRANAVEETRHARLGRGRERAPLQEIELPDARAERHRGAGRGHPLRRLPLRPAHLGRLLRPRRRAEHVAEGSRRRAAAGDGARDRRPRRQTWARRERA